MGQIRMTSVISQVNVMTPSKIPKHKTPLWMQPNQEVHPIKGQLSQARWTTKIAQCKLSIFKNRWKKETQRIHLKKFLNKIHQKKKIIFFKLTWVQVLLLYLIEIITVDLDSIRTLVRVFLRWLIQTKQTSNQ